jgi:excisionase family DNA binding protein
MPDTEPSSGWRLEPPPDRLLLTAEQAADRLGISRTTMYHLLQQGHVRSIKINRCRRVPVRALDQYVESRLNADDGANE